VNRIARVTLEASARTLSVDGRTLDLTTVEYEILARLVRAAGTVIARERLIEEVFERQATPEDRALDVHISHLRKKLGPDASLIVTVRGVGHMLCSASAPLTIDAGVQ
jgi:two-component system, OmpR family, response regulator CpxR